MKAIVLTTAVVAFFCFRSAAVARAREVGVNFNVKSTFDEEAMRAMFPQNFSKGE